MPSLAHLLGSTSCLGIYLGTRSVAWSTVGRWAAVGAKKPAGTNSATASRAPDHASADQAENLSDDRWALAATDTNGDAAHREDHESRVTLAIRQGLTTQRNGEVALDAPDDSLLILEHVVRAHVQAHGPRSPLVIGIAPERSYIASVTDASVEELAAPALMLSRRGLFRAGLIETLAVDVMATDAGVTTVTACSREWIKKIVEICGDAGALVVRIEPAIATIARDAFTAARQVKPRLAANEHAIHLISTERNCAAIWARGRSLLACRSLPHEGAQLSELQLAELHTAVRGLEIFGQQRLRVAALPPVVLHGDASLAPLASELGRQLDSVVRHATRETIGAQATAEMLARSARGTQRGQVDLGRAYWPTAGLLELVPQREFAALLAASLLFSAWVWWGVLDARGRAATLEQQNAIDFTLNSGKEPELRAEEKRLEAEVGAVRRFVSTRRLWTPCLSEIAARIPDSASVEGIIGQQPLTSGVGRGDKSVKQELLIDFVTEFPLDAAVPPEANEALQALRSAPVTSKSFPLTELASLRLDRNKASKDAPDRAKFSILCRARGASNG